MVTSALGSLGSFTLNACLPAVGFTGFNQAVALLRQSGAYPDSVNVDLAQLLENAATYIEIQDAIIKRGS